MVELTNTQAATYVANVTLPEDHQGLEGALEERTPDQQLISQKWKGILGSPRWGNQENQYSPSEAEQQA